MRDELRFLLSKQKKAFYIGWHGYGNLGDEALLTAVKSLLEEKYLLYEKKYVGKGVKIFLKGQFDTCILGGGTLINFDTYLKPFKTVRAKKRIVFGTGVGLPEFREKVEGYTSPYVEEWVQALNSADYIGVRGPLSLKQLKKWGVKKDIVLLGDPVLFLADDVITKKQKSKILGVNIGFTNGRLWGGDDNIFFEQLIQQLKILGRKGWAFKFFPVVTKDVAFIKKAIEALSEFHVMYVDNFLSLNTFLSEMRSVDIFVGEKLHSVILAICTHTPSIMLEYRPKCLDFMLSMNLEKLNVRTDQLFDDTIVEMVKELYDSIDKEQERLFEKTILMKRGLIETASGHRI